MRNIINANPNFRIICIDDTHIMPGFITKGKIYKPLSVYIYSGNNKYEILLDKGDIIPVFARRFTKVILDLNNNIRIL